MTLTGRQAAGAHQTASPTAASHATVVAGRRIDPGLAAAVPPWIVARVLAVAATLFARVAADKLHGGRTFQLRQGWLGWVAWDGGWYRQIALHGYAPLERQALRFFPLYPMLSRALSYPLGGSVDAAMLVIANVSALAAGVLLYRLVVFETGAQRQATLAVWLLALFPAAFVLVWAYAEALFLVTVIGGFLALRQKRWWWAALAGVAAGLLRPVGCLLAIAALVEVVRAAERQWRRITIAQVASVLAPIAGLVAYLAYVGVRFGDWAAPFTVQEGLRGNTVNPATRLVDGLKELTGPQGLKQGLHIPFAVIFIILLVVVFWRWPVSYGLFAAAVLLVSLSSANINSLERYALGAFPLVLGLVSLCFDDRVERAVISISAAGFIALAGLALVGAYVP